MLLANCYLDRGNIEKALAAAQLAAAANADNADAYLVVGAVEQQKGHNRRGAHRLREVSEARPEGPVRRRHSLDPGHAPLVLVLGLESSCDETAAALVEDGVRVRGDAVASQVAVHAE